MNHLGMKQWGFLMLGAVLAGSSLTAAEVAVASHKSQADWQGPANTVKVDGVEVVEMPGRVMLTSTKVFPVDTGKKYRIKGLFRGTSDQDFGRILVGFIPLNANRQPIGSEQCNIVPQTETELLTPATTTTGSVKIKNGTAWRCNNQFYVMAFDVKNDLSDLPNTNISPEITAIKAPEKGKEAEGYEVTFKSPLRKAFPAGTKVREHNFGATYIYAIIGNAGKNWQEFSGIVTGEEIGNLNNNKWRPGTKFARPMILPQAKDAKSKLQIKDVIVEIID